MRAALGLVALTLCAACAGPGDGPAAAATSVDAATVAAAEAVVQQVMASEHVRAVILRVTVDGQEVVTKAWGESMSGVPATTDMHFRNGAMAIPYVATLLLQLVDEKVVSLDDRVSRWLPDVPWSDRVTLGQLAQMTSGYVDYVNTDELAAQQYTDPFRTWTPEDLIAISTKHPLLYEPGTNWNYSHTNYVILGLALEKITGTPVDRLLEEKVLRPLGLSNTADPGTPAIPEPVLHAFTSERRLALHVPDGTPFSEESTYWNPSWTLTRGAIQTTDIRDAEATAVAIGTGTLLSPESYRAMTTKDLIGRTTKVDGCVTCFPNSTDYAYGLGIISSGDWLLQNLMKAHMTAPPPRPSVERADVPPTMDDVIARGMAKNPLDRYPSARDLATAARNASQPWGQPGPFAGPTPTVVAPVAPRSRSRVVAAVSGALALAAACAIGGFAVGNSSESVSGNAAAATTSTTPTGARIVPPPTDTASVTTPPTTVATASSGGRPPKYVYEVISNYPVFLGYTNAAGDQVQESNVPAPWTADIDTSAWGADARPHVIAISNSTKGDTKVTCNIKDDKGKVLVTETKAAAGASASCFGRS